MAEKETERAEKYSADEHLALFEEVAEIADSFENIVKLLQFLKNIKTVEIKGDKGEEGKPGRDGKNGKDGRDGRDGKDGKNGRDGENGKEGPAGRDGKNGSPDTGVDLVKKLMELPEKDRLDIRQLKGLEFLMTKVVQQQSQPSRGLRGIWSGSANPFDVIVGSQVAKNVRSLTFLGVTMVNRNGDVTLAIPGGSGGIVMNEVVSGSGQTYTLGHTPLANTQQIYAAGQRLTPTVDYTISGATISTVSSWSVGDILADYEY